MTRRVRVVSAIGVSCLAFVAARPAHAQVQFGPELSLATNSIGVGIGGRVESSLAKVIPTVKNLSVIGSFDYFFPGTGLGGPSPTYWEINANGAYHVEIPNVKISPYAGAGLVVAHWGYAGYGATNIGLNLLAGTNFQPLGKITPFAELRIELRSGSAFVVTGGVLF